MVNLKHNVPSKEKYSTAKSVQAGHDSWLIIIFPNNSLSSI